jgi:hypothetical protein
VERRIARTCRDIDRRIAGRLAEGVPARQVADEAAEGFRDALAQLPAADAAIARPLLQSRVRALLDRDDP